MIYLMRHGQDEENRIGGWSDAHLSEEGKRQVINTVKTLRKLKIEKIIASDILRCQETVAIINFYLNKKVQFTPILREQNKGKLNGLPIKIAKKQYKDYLNLQDVLTKYPDGESLTDLYNRVEKLLPWLLKQDKALIVTHRGVINMLYYLLQKKALDMNKEQFNVTYASIHEVEPLKLLIRKRN